MRRFLILALVLWGGLGLSGCNLFGGNGEQSTEPAEETPPAEVAPIEEAAPPEQAEDFSEPVVSAMPLASQIASAELIQSTDPNERVRQVQASRSDPFATLPIPAPPEQVYPPPVPPTPPTPVATAGGGAAGGGAAGPSRPGGTTPGQTVPTTPGSIDSSTLPRSPIQPLPLLPQPDLALEVEVTGVVQVGDTLHAIVNAPNEITSRYVTVGQRLSNGRILVKRIELRDGLEPIVVLEQNGVEVPRVVGSNAASDDTATAPNPGRPSA